MPHPEALRLEEIPHQLRDLLVVLDDQDRRSRAVIAAHATQSHRSPTGRGLREAAFIEFSSPVPAAVIGPAIIDEREPARQHRAQRPSGITTLGFAQTPRASRAALRRRTGRAGQCVPARLRMRRLAGKPRGAARLHHGRNAGRPTLDDLARVGAPERGAGLFPLYAFARRAELPLPPQPGTFPPLARSYLCEGGGLLVAAGFARGGCGLVVTTWCWLVGDQFERVGLELGGWGELVEGRVAAGDADGVAGVGCELGEQAAAAVAGLAGGWLFGCWALRCGGGGAAGFGDGVGLVGGCSSLKRSGAQAWREVPGEVVGEHAEEDVCADAVFEAVADRADLELWAFDRFERALDLFELFVGAHDVGGRELVGGDAGAQDVEAVEGASCGDLLGVCGRSEASCR